MAQAELGPCHSLWKMQLQLHDPEELGNILPGTLSLHTLSQELYLTLPFAPTFWPVTFCGWVMESTLILIAQMTTCH